jgi:Zn-dependent protease
VPRLLRVARLRGVPVFVHWSVPVLAAVALLGSGRKLPSAIVAILAYLGMLLIHETGHRLVATRRGYTVYAIEVYPIHAVTRTEAARSELDRSLIAWGGVVAQFIAAAPLTACIIVLGYSRFDEVNAALAVLGFMSPGIALLNLIPMRPLDGAAAWHLFPLLWRRRRTRRDPARPKPRKFRVVR